jgi:hypothetical protein
MATNVVEKKEPAIRRRLKEIALQALHDQGWSVERWPGSRKSSERRITKRGQSLRATIRTARDRWLAFPLTDTNGTRFGPLAAADRVIVPTLDPEDDGYALVFDFPADDIRQRFKKAYEARKRAGHAVPNDGRGIWISLFKRDGHPVYSIGGGAALDQKWFARVPLDRKDTSKQTAAPTSLAEAIAAAKSQIAAAAGVRPEQVRISIEA